MGSVLQYGSDVHTCNLVVDCKTGQITVNLTDGETHRGKHTVTKQSLDYNKLHEILNDPRLAFMDEVVKQKRRKSIDNKNDEEPLTFSISAYKPPNLNSAVRPKATTLGSFRPSLDFGGGLDLGSDLGGMLPVYVAQASGLLPDCSYPVLQSSEVSLNAFVLSLEGLNAGQVLAKVISS